MHTQKPKLQIYVNNINQFTIYGSTICNLVIPL